MRAKHIYLRKCGEKEDFFFQIWQNTPFFKPVTIPATWDALGHIHYTRGFRLTLQVSEV